MHEEILCSEFPEAHREWELKHQKLNEDISPLEQDDDESMPVEVNELEAILNEED